MPKFLVKLSKFGGQYRVTLPRSLVDLAEWEDVEFVIMELRFPNEIQMRRFIDAESLGIKGERNSNGEDH
ncbi:hypothetical protein ES702_05813 [subsurface metagenome]